MKRKIPHACLVITIVFASTFLPAVSSAASRETPRPALRAGTDWLGSPFAWLDSFLERIGRDRQNLDRNKLLSTVVTSEEDPSISGICIDPLGRPRPCPDP